MAPRSAWFWGIRILLRFWLHLKIWIFSTSCCTFITVTWLVGLRVYIYICVCICGVLRLLHPRDGHEGFMCRGTARRHQPQFQRRFELRKCEQRSPWAWAVSSEGTSHASSAARALVIRGAAEGPRDAKNHGCERHNRQPQIMWSFRTATVRFSITTSSKWPRITATTIDNRK